MHARAFVVGLIAAVAFLNLGSVQAQTLGRAKQVPNNCQNI
jgi:hypothetical protein